MMKSYISEAMYTTYSSSTHCHWGNNSFIILASLKVTWVSMSMSYIQSDVLITSLNFKIEGKDL